MTFYVGSVFLVVMIVPWTDHQALVNPYVSALKTIGIPYADKIMNLVIVTAVLSCLNSGIYTASRMLFALADKQDAPQAIKKLTGNGVPVRAILTCTVFGFVSVVMAFISPDTVFQFLLNSSGAIAIFVYLLIAISQLILRKKYERECPEKLKIRMWCFPYLTILTIVSLCLIILTMAYNPDTRSQLFLSVVSFAIVIILYRIKTAVQSRKQKNDALTKVKI